MDALLSLLASRVPQNAGEMLFMKFVERPIITLGGYVKKDDIPNVKEAYLECKDVIFNENTLENFDCIMIADVTKMMKFPKTNLKVIIHDYSGEVTLPDDRCEFYIHASDRKNMEAPVRHFLFNVDDDPIKESKLESELYSNGEQKVIELMGTKFTIVERTPIIEAFKKEPIVCSIHTEKQLETTDLTLFKSVMIKTTQPVLEPEMLENVEDLFVRKFTADCKVNPFVQRLFIDKLRAPSPMLEGLYIHARNANKIRDPIPHYLFHFRDDKIHVERFPTTLFKFVGEQEQIKAFGKIFTVIKREPQDDILEHLTEQEKVAFSTRILETNQFILECLKKREA